MSLAETLRRHAAALDAESEGSFKDPEVREQATRLRNVLDRQLRAHIGPETRAMWLRAVADLIRLTPPRAFGTGPVRTAAVAVRDALDRQLGEDGEGK